MDSVPHLSLILSAKLTIVYKMANFDKESKYSAWTLIQKGGIKEQKCRLANLAENLNGLRDWMIWTSKTHCISIVSFGHEDLGPENYANHA